MDINQLARDSHENSKAHGFWEGEENRSIPVKLCLIHSEISEALESYRAGEALLWLTDKGKPEGIAAELADAVIRIGDLCEFLNIDLANAISMKAAYNKTRPFKHGKVC